MDSTTSSNSNYVMLEGLSIEMAASEFEVYLTPDIDINKNLSMESVTSSIRGETGAPMVKHLHTFSQEETDEEIDLSNLSICTTEEERDEDVKNKIRIRRNEPAILIHLITMRKIQKIILRLVLLIGVSTIHFPGKSKYRTSVKF
jgi:hypothetical protein